MSVPGALCRSIRGTQACPGLTAVLDAWSRDSNSLQDVPQIAAINNGEALPVE
jgi:hypothetical protein